MNCPFDLTSTMPTATVGTTYSQDIIASNGVSPYVFSNIRKYSPAFSGLPYSTILNGLSANFIDPDKLRISGTPMPFQIQITSQDTQNPDRSIWNELVLGTQKFTFSVRIINSCSLNLPQAPIFNGENTNGIQYPILRIVPGASSSYAFIVIQGDRTDSIGKNARVWGNTAGENDSYNTNNGCNFVVGEESYYDSNADETYIKYPADFGTQEVGDGYLWYCTSVIGHGFVPKLFGVGDSASYIENLLNTSLSSEWASKIRFRVFFSDDSNWRMPVIFMEGIGNWCKGPYTIQYLIYNANSQRFSSSSSVDNGQIQFKVNASDDNGCIVTDSIISIPLIPNCQPHTILPMDNVLPKAKKGKHYEVIFTTSGGIAPYTYSIFAGTIPAGWTLDSAGKLSGIYTEGTYTFTIQSKDANGCACDCKEFTISGKKD